MLQLGHAPLKLAEADEGVVKLVGGVVVEVVVGLDDEAVEPFGEGVEACGGLIVLLSCDSVLTLLLLLFLLLLELAAAAKAVVRLLYE